MIIHFGIHLDSLAQERDMPFGSVRLGPAVLLNVLETQLGLTGGRASRAQALVAYRGCLEKAQSAQERFYTKSFGVDPVGVAQTLLRWRDTWYEHGWNGTFPPDAPARLLDMADVERLAGPELQSPGQRLHRILEALEDRHTQIEKIILLNDPTELPTMWRRVLDHFPLEMNERVLLSPHEPKPSPLPRAGEGQGEGSQQIPSADANTDLGKAQRTLLAALSQDQPGTPNKTTLTNDGTLILLRAASRDISAQAVAEYLTHTLAPDTDALVIAERDGIIIDNAFARVGAPRCGFRHYSRFRAAGQVLKLCLGLVWAPVNPRLLQQFLLHPVGPLNRFVRARLAQAVAEQPGVGGQRWREELARSLERIGERETPEQVARVEQAVRFWLENPRHVPHDGAPIQALIERAQACADWLARRAHNADQASERESFATAHRQARDLIDALGALSDQNRSRVPKVELDRLLDEATGPLSDPEAFSEAGHVLALEQPAAAIEPRDHVVWWDLAPKPTLGRYPWSAKELAALNAHGVELRGLDTLHRQEARHALRPVMAARRQLVLVCHEREGRDHPLLSQLVSLFDGLPEVVLDSHLTGAEAEPVIPQLQVPTLELPTRPLPAKRRWWHLPEDARPAPRETESYSSLEKLLCHPHIWLLQYAARLREGSAGNLPGESLLHGNLAHHVFERFFNAHPDWRDMQEDQVLSWLSAMLDELIETEAVVLLGPGQAVRRERVVTTIRRALLSLLAHLRSTRIASVQPESPATAPFEDGAITGTIDLLLTDEDGRETVLDVKWGSEKYRLDLLQNNQPLQLVTYAYLRRQAGGSRTRWPATAFFIVETGDVLAQDNATFPNAITSPSANGEGIPELWSRVLRSYDWRRHQLAEGDVEVIVAGTESDPTAEPPEDGFVVPDQEPNKFDPYTALTGWEPSQ